MLRRFNSHHANAVQSSLNSSILWDAFWPWMTFCCGSELRYALIEFYGVSKVYFAPYSYHEKEIWWEALWPNSISRYNLGSNAAKSPPKTYQKLRKSLFGENYLELIASSGVGRLLLMSKIKVKTFAYNFGLGFWFGLRYFAFGIFLWAT